MFVKVCGLRDAAMARHAASEGADAVGVVMSEPSPRHATPQQALEVIAAAKGANPAVDAVLVVREMPAAEAAETAARLGFDVLQLHGRYSPADFAEATRRFPRVWRATSLAREPEPVAGELGEELLLLDGANAGSGEVWDLAALERASTGERWLLAGGLTAENVAAAVAEVRPWGVDVSSGVEGAPGVKSAELVSRFLAAAKVDG